jgi:NAD(P)-dependent dehydrogenase (short-subunit alcohol dehydrogenase family)
MQLTHTFSHIFQVKQTILSTKLVAFILGAGTHIGSAVASQLREKGYRVALGSCNPKPTSDDDAYFNVKVDVQKRESIEEAFDIVVHKLGPVNVVIYNGMSLISPCKYTGAGLTSSIQLLLSLHHKHPMTSSTIPVDAYYDAAFVGLGAFTATQKVLTSFRNEIDCQHPKAFIVTGNILHNIRPTWISHSRAPEGLAN